MNRNLGPQFAEAARRVQPVSQGGEGGFTMHPVTGEFATGGWAVGGTGAKEGQKDIGRVTGRTVAAYARLAGPALATPQTHIGGWHNRATGKAVFDASVVEPDMHKAIGLMGTRGEDAMFNLDTHQTYWNQGKHPMKFGVVPPAFQRKRSVRIQRRTG